MSKLPNRFERRIDDFIAEMKALPFPFTDSSWNESKWAEDLNFSRMGVRFTKGCTKADLITPRLRELAKAIIVYKKIKHSASRHSLVNVVRSIGVFEKGLEAQEILDISAFNTACYESCISAIESYTNRTGYRQNLLLALNQLLRFMVGDRAKERKGSVTRLKRGDKCKLVFASARPQDKFLSTPITIQSARYSVPSRGKNGSILAKDQEKKASKLPDTKVILALGSIYYRAMPSGPSVLDSKNDLIQDVQSFCDLEWGAVDYSALVRDRFVSSYTSLLLSNPDRVNEIILLDAAGIHKHNAKDDTGKPLITYVMSHRGSKGMMDFKKTILDCMAPIAVKTVMYLKRVCQPARVLARYYEDPNLPLRELLRFEEADLDQFGELTVNDISVYRDYRGLDPAAPVNLWQLAGVLGFYDDLPAESRLLQIPGFPYNCDPDYRLTSWNQFNELVMAPSKVGAWSIERRTLRYIQDDLIDYIKSKIPHFPYRQHENGKKVRLADALFLYTGNQVYSSEYKQTGSGYHLARSPFAIESMQLPSLYKRELTGTSNIFERYGFPYQMSTHQPRHFLNTLAQKGGMAEEVLALWSGRASVAENEDYDGRSTSDKHHELIILFREEEEQREVQIVDAESFQEHIGLVAHKMRNGYCVQSLHINPCLRENQCIGCTRNCHIKGDRTDLALLKADEKHQRYRLSIAIQDAESKGDVMAAKWIDLHKEKLLFVSSLIDVHENPAIEDGSLIRFTGENYNLRVCNPSLTAESVYVPQLPDLTTKSGEEHLPVSVPENEDVEAEVDAWIEDIISQAEAENTASDTQPALKVIEGDQ